MITRRGMVSGMVVLAAGGCSFTHARNSDPPPPDRRTGEPMALIPGYDSEIRSYEDGVHHPDPGEPLTRAVLSRTSSGRPPPTPPQSGNSSADWPQRPRTVGRRYCSSTTRRILCHGHRPVPP